MSRGLALAGLCAWLSLGAAWGQYFKLVPSTFSGASDSRNRSGGSAATSAFADFDKDGDLDLLYSMREGNTVYRNEGGRFSEVGPLNWTLHDATSAVWADVDGDGYTDILVDTCIVVKGPTTQENVSHTEFRRLTWSTAQARFHSQPESSLNMGGRWMESPLLSSADFDRDGDPDLLVTGIHHSLFDSVPDSLPFGRIFRNVNGKFQEFQSLPEPVWNATAAWADFDGDGDLDLFLSGNAGKGIGVAASLPIVPSTRVYRCTPSGFELFASFPNLAFASAAWADLDGEGWLDLGMCGTLSADQDQPATLFYRATPTGFVPMAGGVDSVSWGSLSFADMDRDGDQDLILSGTRAPGVPFTGIYRKDPGGWHLMPRGLPAVDAGLVFWADYDKDGNLDIFLSGMRRPENVAVAQLFRNVRGEFRPAGGPALPQNNTDARWGDYDNDGDLDLLVSRTDQAFDGSQCTLLMRNDGGKFHQALDTIPYGGGVDWGDYDGDGRLDFAVAGVLDSSLGAARIYRNRGDGTFQALGRVLDPKRPEERHHSSSVRWGDMDADGDLDLVVWGGDFTAVFRNDGNDRFSKLDNIISGKFQRWSWGDFDGDGDLDLLATGDGTESIASQVAVFRNDRTAFVRTQDRLGGFVSTQSAWGDFDNDGDLDIAANGIDPINNAGAWIFRNQGGVFEPYVRTTAGTNGGALAWGDLDNDGDLDLVDGKYVHFNDVGTFSSFLSEIPDATIASLDLADLDADGDLDALVTGYQGGYPGSSPITVTLLNQTIFRNGSPAIPDGLRTTLGLGSVTLAWNPSGDAETPPDGLQYNVRVGRMPGRDDVAASMAAPDGFRRRPGPGNAGHRPARNIGGLALGNYYWSVQALDQGMAPSAFAAEGSFTLGVSTPVLREAVPGNGQVTLRWNRLADANFGKYYVHYATGSSPALRMDSTASAADTAITLQNLSNETRYYFRVSAVDQGGNPGGFSNELSTVTDGIPPRVPQGLTAKPGDRSITLTWQPNAEPDFLCYLVYQSSASGPLQLIDSITDIGVTARAVKNLDNGTRYGFQLRARDKVGNPSAYSPEVSVQPIYLVSQEISAIAYGRIPRGTGKDTTVRFRNDGDLPVSLDSLVFAGGEGYVVPDAPAALAPGATTAFTLRFQPPAATDFDNRRLLVYYGGASTPMEIRLSGAAVAPPSAAITGITPSELDWDTVPAFNFLSAAKDSDEAGPQPQVRAYLWSSSLAGPLPDDRPAFALSPAQLGIGRHTITLRVVDNEGDTSPPATAVLTVLNRKPLVRIDTITPRNIILRGKNRVSIRCTARDQDEWADDAHDSLRVFQIHSTLQGLLGTSKEILLDTLALQLGTHGFYALAVDDEGDTALSETIRIDVQTEIGTALIVAGSAFKDPAYFYENIATQANWGFAKLRQRGYPKELIEYMNPVGWQSIDDINRNSEIVDHTDMTAATLHKSLQYLGEYVKTGVPLLVALIGHGNQAEQNGRFYLGQNEVITPDSLDAWLDSIPAPANTPLVILLDFCNAGSFIPKLRSDTQRRVVIASSAADHNSYFNLGRSFGYNIFQGIRKGEDLERSSIQAKDWSDHNAVGNKLADPEVNSDRDDKPNNPVTDIEPLRSIYLGGTQNLQPPEAEWTEVKRTRFDPDTRTLYVQATADNPSMLDAAWFAVLPPQSDPQSPPPDSLPRAPLVLQNGVFSGSLALEEMKPGNYLVIVYGRIGNEQILPMSRPEPLTTGILPAGGALRFGLDQNFPNPVLGQTTIRFQLTRKGPVRVLVHALDGRKVKTLANALLMPGAYALPWDGRDDAGKILPAGVYGYSILAGEGVKRRKLVLGR